MLDTWCKVLALLDRDPNLSRTKVTSQRWQVDITAARAGALDLSTVEIVRTPCPQGTRSLLDDVAILDLGDMRRTTDAVR